MLIRALQAAAGNFGVAGYNIDNSLRFNDNDSAYLSRTPSSTSDTRTWTWSGWVKRGNIGVRQFLFSAGTDGNNHTFLRFNSTDDIYFVTVSGGSVYGEAKTLSVFRDPVGWYHITIAFDASNATGSNRLKIYVNGEEQTISITDTIENNTNYHKVNRSNAHNIGARAFVNTSDMLDAYLAEINFIDGQALTADDFGQIDATTGEWSPKKYSGTYGTNGFYLPFNGNANDDSGNGNNWTENNLASTDYMIDTPTNNFAIWNPLAVSSATFSQGNLNAVMSSSTPSKITSTFAVSSGKYFMEYEYKGNNNWPVGISADAIQRDYLGMSDGNTSISFWCGTSATSVYINGVSQSFSGSATTWTSGDIVGVALDADNQEVSLYKNGTLVGSSVSYSTYGWSQAFFAAGNYLSGNQYISNFGQDSSFAGLKTRQGNTDANGIGDFYYTPPAGYLALCTDNLPAPAIEQPETQFNVVTYTGNGGTQSITGVGFQPDFVWAKLRTTSSYHRLHDVVRGSDNTLASNVADAEVAGNGIVSFDSDGFTMDSGTNINQPYPYVAWCWKAGGTAVTNTDGSITSQVSANVDAGFSIVSWTSDGSSSNGVGHGLSETPTFFIYKTRNSVAPWYVWTTLIDGSNDQLLLNDTNSKGDIVGYGSPSSTTISNYGFGSGVELIAYCFHSVEGFSKFGTYAGNSSADGPFVYLGFKPAFVLIKASNSAQNWHILDNTRDPYNPSGRWLRANLSDAEVDYTSTYPHDFLSNGFKLRGYTNSLNASGSTYIYMAFAEAPLKNSLGR